MLRRVFFGCLVLISCALVGLSHGSFQSNVMEQAVKAIKAADRYGAGQRQAKKPVRILLRVRETGALALSGSIGTIALSQAEDEADAALRKNLALDVALKGVASVDVDSISEVAVSGDTKQPGIWTKSPDGYSFVVTKEINLYQAGASSMMGSSDTVSVEETWKLEKHGQAAALGEWKIAYDFEKAPSVWEKEKRSQHYRNVVKEKVEPARRPVLIALRQLISSRS